MGLTKRRGSYYVEFPVLDDGKALTLARGIAGARLKRWKVGSLNKTVAKQQESLIKTDLMKGSIRSDQARPTLFKDWGLRYLELEEVKRLGSYRDRNRIIRHQLIPYFGSSLLPEVRPEDVEHYRAQRRKEDGSMPSLNSILTPEGKTKRPIPPRSWRGVALIHLILGQLHNVSAAHIQTILKQSPINNNSINWDPLTAFLQTLK